MKSGILLSVCLLVLASSSSLRTNEVKTTLLQVDQSTLGNAILSTIHLQLMGDTPTETITELLVEIKNDLLAQAAQNDIDAGLAEEKCEGDKANQQEQIDDLNDQISGYDTAIDTASDTISTLEGDLADARNRLETLEGDLANAEAARAEQAELHATWDGDYDGAIRACQECIDIIRRLEDDTENPTDVEKALEEPTATMLAQMTDQMKLEYGPTIESLAQLALSADQGAVAEIIELLEELIRKFEEARDAQGLDEATQIEMYEESVQHLQEAIDEVTADILRMEGELTEANNAKTDAEGSKATAEGDLLLADEAFGDLVDACNTEAGQYSQKGIDISEEIAIIEQVEGIMRDRIDPMEDYLSERVDTYDF